MTTRLGLALAALLAAIGGCDRVAGTAEEQPHPDEPYRLHFQVIAANGGGATAVHLGPVEDELRKVFRFDNYSLIGEGYVMVSSGSFSLELLGEHHAEFDVDVDGVTERRVETDDTSFFVEGTIQRDLLHMNVRKKSLQTMLRFRPGQTLLLGSMPEYNGAAGRIETVFVVVHIAQGEGESA